MIEASSGCRDPEGLTCLSLAEAAGAFLEDAAQCPGRAE